MTDVEGDVLYTKRYLGEHVVIKGKIFGGLGPHRAHWCSNVKYDFFKLIKLV